MRKKIDSGVRIATLLTPFAALIVLAAAGASDETISAAFLTASFICYLVMPTLYLERRRQDQG